MLLLHASAQTKTAAPATAPCVQKDLPGIFREWRGKQWDPQIVDLVLGLIDSGELQLGADGLHLLEQSPPVLSAPGLSVLLVEDNDEEALLVTEALEHALKGAVISRGRLRCHCRA